MEHALSTSALFQDSAIFFFHWIVSSPQSPPRFKGDELLSVRPLGRGRLRSPGPGKKPRR